MAIMNVLDVYRMYRVIYVSTYTGTMYVCWHEVKLEELESLKYIHADIASYTSCHFWHS